ncbi:MAG: hypothetical protein U0411_08790 [Thermodesulfovibrionales bacterium]
MSEAGASARSKAAAPVRASALRGQPLVLCPAVKPDTGMHAAIKD